MQQIIMIRFRAEERGMLQKGEETVSVWLELGGTFCRCNPNKYMR